MKKYDIKKEYPQLYRAMTKKISSLVVPKLKYIAIDGIGNPTVPEFRNKSKLLFLINKSLKEYYQKQEISFSGAKLEGLWDTYDNSHFDVTLDVYLKEFEEGECIQMLHIGPYNTEINSTKQIMEYITVANLKLSGLHHEIYLNKPERVAPENLKTIVRYPVEEDLI